MHQKFVIDMGRISKTLKIFLELQATALAAPEIDEPKVPPRGQRYNPFNKTPENTSGKLVPGSRHRKSNFFCLSCITGIWWLSWSRPMKFEVIWSVSCVGTSIYLMDRTVIVQINMRLISLVTTSTLMHMSMQLTMRNKYLNTAIVKSYWVLRNCSI